MTRASATMTETPAGILENALEIGDKLVAELTRCEGRGCEADEVRQILKGIRNDELDNAEARAA